MDSSKCGESLRQFKSAILRNYLKLTFLYIWHICVLILVTFVAIVTLQLFLNECSTDEWFTSCAGLFRDVQHVSIKVLEKMSIVLQRLSKVK